MAPKTRQQSAAAEAVKPHGYEFFGPPGAFVISFGLPLLVYTFTFLCNDISGCPAPSMLSPSTLNFQQLKLEVGWPADGIWGFASWRVSGWVLAYYAFNALLWRVLPGTEMQGVVLSNGGRIHYKFNAFSSSMLTLSLALAGTLAQGSSFVLWTFIADNYLQIITTNVLIAYALATFVYVRSFQVKPGNAQHRELALGGQTGNMLYDWFIGRELNPRVVPPLIGEVDIKEFMELRPGMLGWVLLNCAWVAKQHRDFGFVTDGIIFITAVQAFYVADGWFMETAILTTMDITTDGFGLMLAYGDLAWLPFMYTQQTRYLAAHPVSLGPAGLAAMFGLLATGYYIFRSANSEKNAFRSNPEDPKVAHLEYLETKSGSRLLTTGWWGVARHINYLGDWIQSWPYSLPTGLAGYTVLAAGTGAPGAFVRADGAEIVAGAARGWATIFTYFYVLYFAILLLHRDRRDDEKCHRKYGADWEKYKTIVRYRILPGVY